MNTKNQRAVVVILLMFAAILEGFLIAFAYEFAWALLGALLIVVFFASRLYTFIVAIVFVSSLSRLAVAWGLTPSIVNYFHFPLVITAALTASIKQHNISSGVTRLGAGILGLLMISLVSWLINGGELLRPLLGWIILVEPFLLVYALTKCPPNSKEVSQLWKVILFIAFLQIPISFWQAFTQGMGDPVQGTFVGLGQGAGAASAVALIAATIIFTRMYYFKKGLEHPDYGLVFVLLVLIPILADAKHVLAAFGLSILYVLARERLFTLRTMLASAGLFLILYLAALYYPPIRLIVDPQTFQIVVVRKLVVLKLFSEHAWEKPWAWLIGFGPGNTFSYLALQAKGGIGNLDSPISRLGLSLSSITQEAIETSFAVSLGFGTPYLAFVERTSAAWQIWSSWSGVWGDFGVLGLITYVSLWLVLWRSLDKVASWQTTSGKAILLFVFLLGAIYRWLEEPNLTIIVAVVVGLAIVSSKMSN